MWSTVISNFLSFESLIALVIGVVGGMIIGALPGLNATMAISLLIPITYTMSPYAAFTMMMAVYTSAFYGGSLTAILIHTPGTPSSAATAGDGYALTQQGRGQIPAGGGPVPRAGENDRVGQIAAAGQLADVESQRILLRQQLRHIRSLLRRPCKDPF